MTPEQYKLNLAMLGPFEPTNILFDWERAKETLENQAKDHWRYYNKSKPGYNRYGLSLFSLDGSDSGEIDLNSVKEHNNLNNTAYDEMSFNTPTQWWEKLTPLSAPLKPLQEYLGRSHLIKLNLGGFFPPHRDCGESFRLISFFDCDHECLHFISQGKVQYFECNRLYYADTTKIHSLVSFKEDSNILVLNVKPCKETYDFVLRNLKAQ